MKLYVTTDKEGNVLAWAGTQSDARAAKKEHGGKDWSEVEVPTGKQDLLAFLQKNATGKKLDLR